jgi:beta-lactamase regulating signal transducer with metallopeptidase domain
MSWVQGALAMTLVRSLWEGAAVALALAVVLCFARSSAGRYAASCIAMLALLGGLVITFNRLVPAPPTGIRETAIGPTPYSARVFSDVPSTVSTRESGPVDYATWVVRVWIAGVFVFYLRGVMSWMAARRLRRSGVCCATDAWQDRMDRLRARLRVTRPVALLESCLAEAPVAIGYLRPVILMPLGSKETQ